MSLEDDTLEAATFTETNEADTNGHHEVCADDGNSNSSKTTTNTDYYAAMHNVSVNEGGHVTLRGSQFLNANGAVALTTTHMAVQIWADDAPKMQDL